jgi:hypothetical protein
MAEESSRLHGRSLEQLNSWIRLFRAPGVAIDAKKLLLAALGLIVFTLGRGGIDRLFSMSEDTSRLDAVSPAFLEPPDPARPVFADVRSAPMRLTEPARVLVGPYVRLFSLGNRWRGFFHAFATALWGTLIWGIVGGAIARIAVVQLARTDQIGLGEAARFAGRKWLSLVGTPLSSLLGIAFFTALFAVFGLLYRLPAPIGPALAGILAVFPLLAGLVMTIVLISLALGWPLMHATIAAEGEDGFDALSRSFAYVNQRPARYLALVAVAWAVGILGLVFVELVARMTIHMAQWSLSFGAPGDLLAAYYGGATSQVTRGGHAFWLSVIGTLTHGWIYAYFWTSAVIIYLILRQDIDGNPWHEIAPPERKSYEFNRAPTPASPEEPDTSGTPQPRPTPEVVASDAPTPS